MISVTVKTLDSQNHAFDVEEDIKVKEFKETISPTIGIPVEQQRLIFRGRVLQDDKKISEYNVANNVVHVVQRPANQNNTSNDEPPPRPSSQAGRDGGLFISAEDLAGGGGRNGIFMGAIGLPTIDIDNGGGGEGNGPRRSGAQVRLMVGNSMLNRASTLLHQLEDDDATFAASAAATATASSASGGASGPSPAGQNQDGSSPSSGGGVDLTLGGGVGVEIMEGDAAMDIDIDVDDEDQASIERIISQVVNASSAAAIVAAVSQANPQAMGGGTGGASASTQQPVPPPHQASTSSSSSNNNAGTGNGTSGTGAGSQNQTRRTPAGRVESPRLRELATSFQDLLALQERLTPFLRLVQSTLSQNRAYTEQGETQSTQFLFDTMSSILHLLSHSLHSFSDIMCDFSTPPEDRRLMAPSSILVEQSTAVLATIPVAVPAGAMYGGGGINLGGLAAAAAAAGGNNNPAGGTGAQPNATNAPTSGAGGNNNAANANPFSNVRFVMPNGQIAGGGFNGFNFPAGMNQPWQNPNLQGAPTTGGNGTAQGPGSTATPPPPQPNPQQQQQQQANNNAASAQLATGLGLPAGLQNLGALLGMAGGGGSTVSVNVFAGPAGGGVGVPGGMFAQGAIPLGQFRMGGGQNNNNDAGAGAGAGIPAGGNNPFQFIPPGQGQQNASATANANRSTNSATGNGVGASAGSNNNNANGAAMLQNLLRGDHLNRPQFDALVPCRSHHTLGRYSRSTHPNQVHEPTRRPPEFRQFVNVVEGEASSSSTTTPWGGQAEGESLEIIMDLLRNSRLIDSWLVPLARDVVLNYLMRGRDPKNDAHVRTCAKGLAKKILPFLEKFEGRIEGRNEAVDIPATYTNIFTEFITTLMTKIIEGAGQFQKDLLNALTELQKQLIQAFRLCYSSAGGGGSVGLRFVNYLVDHFLGGMSIVFKTQTRQKLTEQLKQLEEQTAIVGGGSGDATATSSFIVYKSTPPAGASATASAASATSLGSRCAASFGGGSSTADAVPLQEGPSSSPSTSSPVKQEPPRAVVVSAAAANSDDVDIDEMLTLPQSMVPQQQQQSPSQRSPAAAAVGSPQGRANQNQTESLVSLVRSLPSEWESTLVQDIRRQRDMPAQPSFSPGFNTLFPRKH